MELIKNFKETSIIKNLIIAICGTILLAVSAKVKIPFYPVPMTMQTFVVLLLGVSLGWKLGLFTVSLYLIQGIAGLPVFAGTPEKGIGLLYMAGPTGGYLVGFALAAGLTGWLAERGLDRSVIGTAIAMIAGNLVIYVFGLAWLANFVGFEKAVTFGLIPFLFGDLIKIMLATASLPVIWKFLNRDRP